MSVKLSDEAREAILAIYDSKGRGAATHFANSCGEDISHGSVYSIISRIRMLANISERNLKRVIKVYDLSEDNWQNELIALNEKGKPELSPHQKMIRQTNLNVGASVLLILAEHYEIMKLQDSELERQSIAKVFGVHENDLRDRHFGNITPEQLQSIFDILNDALQKLKPDPDNPNKEFQAPADVINEGDRIVRKRIGKAETKAAQIQGRKDGDERVAGQ